MLTEPGEGRLSKACVQRSKNLHGIAPRSTRKYVAITDGDYAQPAAMNSLKPELAMA